MPYTRRLRRNAIVGAAAVMATFDTYALTVGAIDDVVVAVTEGGAPAVEKTLQHDRAVTLVGGAVLDITCQLSATEVIGNAQDSTVYAINPDFLVPIEPVQPPASWTDTLHDCSQPVQYNTRPPQS